MKRKLLLPIVQILKKSTIILLIFLLMAAGLYWVADRYFFQLENKAQLTGDRQNIHSYDKNLGYKAIPNTATRITKKYDGKEIYSAIYTINHLGFRVVPEQDAKSDRIFLCFGCSMTFGEGVQDNETYPYYISQYASGARANNYGIPGYGPQHLLEILKNPSLCPREINKQYIALYVFIDHHIQRVAGSLQVAGSYGKEFPYYELDASGKPVRNGNFSTARPIRSFVYKKFSERELGQYFLSQKLDFPRVRKKDIHLAGKIFEAARDTFKDRFNSDDFYVVFYPGAMYAKEMVPFLENSNIHYLNYSKLDDFYGRQMSIEHDGHPTPEAYRIIAQRIVRDLNLSKSSVEEK